MLRKAQSGKVSLREDLKGEERWLYSIYEKNIPVSVRLRNNEEARAGSREDERGYERK